MTEKLTIRFATPDDTPLILTFIRALAEYVKMPEQVTATEEQLRLTIFDQKHAEVLLAEYEGKPAGFALFFHNYSTFLGKPGLFLEDLFVFEEMRSFGIGRALLSTLAAIAVKRDCGRLEWECLDWNESSIAFYKRMGAVAMDEHTIYRLTGERLQAVAVEREVPHQSGEYIRRLGSYLRDAGLV